MANVYEIAHRDVMIDLPESECVDVLYVFPIESKYVRAGGGGGGSCSGGDRLREDKCDR